MAFTFPNTILNQYPLTDSNNTGPIPRYDGIDPAEMINFIFKKQFGIGSANPYANYSGDLAFNTLATPTASLDKQYSQVIPYSSPTDIVQDTTFHNKFYSGNRYTSAQYPYLVYYENIQMVPLSDYGFLVYDKDINGNNITNIILTQNTVSRYYGSLVSSGYSDMFIVYDGSGNTLQFGDPSYGSWLLDTDSGILTFYDDITATDANPVNYGNPPRISFWRYEGLIGNNSIMTVQDF